MRRFFVAPAVLVEGVGEALATLRRNPLRGTLASLAMAAAVATTAVVQTSLDGLAESARRTSARAFGTDAFVVAKVAPAGLSRRELADAVERHPNITRSDTRFLAGVAADRVIYAATVQRSADVSAGGRTFEGATVAGAQATLSAIRDVGLERGRFLSPADDTSGAQVAILGRALVDELFPGSDPLGRSVRIGGRGFTVIGTLVLQGSAGGQSLDRFAWIPLTAFERTFGAPPTLQVFAGATPGVSIEHAEDRARISMRARRRLAPGTPDTFALIRPEASRSFVERITERLGAAGPPISLMALLAAMVVVMNTTLVSVAQRTREIGLRRAVGAGRANVLVETLAEALIVALAGGGAGLLLATALLAFAAGQLGVPLSLSGPVVAGSVAAAAASGVAAGWLPARRAASLDIVAALRQE
jgi:putative ABC transport system permease protein